MDSDEAYDHWESILLDENEEPTKLPIWFLESITNKFSEDQKIGSGGFADVYKGLLKNGSVAVKRLNVSQSEMVDEHEAKFNQEVDTIMRVKHKNIVRFLGYCADTQGKLWKYEGKNTMAEERQRFLCFELMTKGSLDKYISDASKGLDWKTRYQIIKGVCDGLHHLHQLRIIHLDLKPANILLDDYMVPKITDFGISKCFDEKQTRAVTSNFYGSAGYMAPEYYDDGEITFKSDIYSLGKLIIEILTGRKGYLDIESVRESWKTRFETSDGGTWLEHVEVCAVIGIECIDPNPAKRPTMQKILDSLDKLECMDDFTETDGIDISSATEVLFEVQPLEVRFPLEPKSWRPVCLMNRTDDFVGVWITPSCPDTCSSCRLGCPYLWVPGPKPSHELMQFFHDEHEVSSKFYRLSPHSSTVVYMTMKEQQQPPPQADACMFEIVMFAPDQKNYHNGKEHMKMVMKHVKVHHRVTLRAFTCDQLPRRGEVVAIATDLKKLRQQSIKEFGQVQAIDVHPTETWILVSHSGGHVSVWNYQTQERVMKFNNVVTGGGVVWSIKFIAAQKWFAFGDSHGLVHVFSYTAKEGVKQFRAHRDGKPYGRSIAVCLAVHPTDTLLLTAFQTESLIKLWDWSRDWECTRVFETHNNHEVDGVRDLMFGPRGTNTFAATYYAIQDVASIKVWDINNFWHDEPELEEDSCRRTPTFYTDSHGRRFLISSNGYAANIRDWETKKCIHQIRVKIQICRGCEMVVCHPTLPLLATITSPNYYKKNEWHIFFWDARTYRLITMAEILLEGNFQCMAFVGTEYAIRLVVASTKGASVIKIIFPNKLKADLLRRN